jgi:DNA mismatch repair protein MutH
MFFLHEPDKLDIEYIFKIIRLWQFPANDLKIIKDDWEKIVGKIRAGKAHELSEGDTFYLGACTKGANSTSLRKQPFSEAMAMQRAFSLKSKYLNFIIAKSLAKEDVLIDYDEYDKILEENVLSEVPPSYRRIRLNDVEPVIKNITDYNKGETFEELIYRKFNPYLGKSEAELIELLHLKKSKSKSRFFLLSREIVKGILGISKNKIEEFEKADIEMKTVRLEQNGGIKESMSFAQIQFKEIIDEEWEDSYWYNVLTKRFFFIVFQKDESEQLRLKKVLFWTMPMTDLDVAKSFWLDTQEKIRNDDYDNFIRISDNRICHVRPKGADSRDKMETPSGRLEKKKCYWLNSSYIKNAIAD